MQSDFFQNLYAGDPDPWHVRDRWYEQRKRALVLACLPERHYRHAYEPACGNGELTAALAQRCDHVSASDGAQSAVLLTTEKVQQEIILGCVDVQQQFIPADWPKAAEESFDLILISEVAYYLVPDALAVLVRRAVETLIDGGTVLLCHWRHPFEDRMQATREVHAAFDASRHLHSFLHHDDSDFVIDVWIKTGSPAA